jgi:predicted glycoside hydrolase/deacetylase ChbG (UPF0249 family)
MGTKQLIVTAEDFGRSSPINQGIAKAHAEGIVTSATLVVGGGAAQEAAALSAEHPKLSLGLCLVFTDGEPVLPPTEVPSLVGPSGTFPEGAEALAAARLDDVLAEGRAQLRRFREMVHARPSHFSTQGAVHAQPVVLEALLCLSWETGVGFPALSEEMRERLRYERVPTPDQYLDTFSPSPSVERLAELLAGIPAGTAELLCRPALGGDTTELGSRQAELAVLTSAEARQALQAAGIQLVAHGAA